MSNNLTDLLPSDRRDALASEYRYRLGVVIMSLVTVLTFVAAILLMPTYVFLAGSASAKDEQLSSIRRALSASNQVALSAQLTALTSDAAVLTALSGAPSASQLISTAFAVPRTGVSVSGFTYTPAEGKAPGVLALSGIATTRDALRSYQLALQSASFARAADLPVSAYAKDANIDFTITITLAP